MKYGTKKAKARIVVPAGMAAALLFLVQGISMGQPLRATPDQVEFGTVAEGDPVVAVSEIANTGGTPVEITNVRTT
ncbi:MAG: hypothetical protein JW793_01765 [Acidobacteria bacterium]|nr:hypothetical protein [Acidobacteriota bacterium]